MSPGETGRCLSEAPRPAIVALYVRRTSVHRGGPEDFHKEDLVLDNHVYKSCQIDKCRLYYSGGPFELIDTHITESELVLNQPAKNIYAAIQIFRSKSPGSTVVFE